MEKKKISTGLKIAIAAGILVALAVFLYTQASKGLTAVVVAKKTLPAGKVVQKEDIDFVEMRNPPAGALTREDEVVGKKLALPRLAGDVISRDSLQGPGVMVPAGKLGLLIPVNDRNLLEIVKPNDRITFIAVDSGAAAGESSFPVGEFTVLMVIRGSEGSFSAGGNEAAGSLFVAGDGELVARAAGYVKDGEFQIAVNPDKS